MGKKINELTPATDANAVNGTRLFAQADPITGVAEYITVAQARTAFSIKKVKYTATGAEGTTITIGALEDMDIVFILREAGPIFEVVSSPDPAEFTWDGVDVELGTATSPGERFLIGYQYP